MCLALIAFHTIEDWPVLIAANRDEFYDRPGTPPRPLDHGAGTVLAPRDPRHGGTWIGVNERRLFALITNRVDCPDQAGGRSRGLLVHDVLGEADLPGARRRLDEERELPSDPYNLLVGDGRRLLCVERCGAAPSAVRELPPGVYVATNHGPISDPAIGEVARALAAWGAGLEAGRDPLQVARELLALDAPDAGLPAICKDLGDRGTVSATVIAIDREARIHMFHAEGPPNRHPYVPVPFPETGSP